MKKFDGLEDILQHILSDIATDMMDIEVKGKIPIGVVSEETRLKYLAWRNQKDEFEEELNDYKNMLIRRFEREMAEKFEERYHQTHKEKKELWKAIRKELNLDDPEIELNIDPKTGLISQWVESHEQKSNIRH